jgi:hypothetical protein
VAELDTYATGYRESRERFERDTAQHELTIIRDDGLYRHLRFQRPDSVFYWYDLVTWPGRLVIGGDAGDWMFTRSRDMFEFFEASGGRINPDYWAEKLVAPRSAGARVYSHEAFRARVLDWALDFCADWGGGEGIYPSLLVGALEREVIHDWTHHEQEARERLELLDHELGYVETWEWDLRTYDWSFLWCCWAIVRGIARYRAAKSNATPDRCSRTAPHGDPLAVARV